MEVEERFDKYFINKSFMGVVTKVLALPPPPHLHPHPSMFGVLMSSLEREFHVVTGKRRHHEQGESERKRLPWSSKIILTRAKDASPGQRKRLLVRLMPLKDFMGCCASG